MLSKVVTLVALLLVTEASCQSVNIKIYYESLCPYSRQIITEHLHPTFHSDLGKYMDVDFIPINNGRDVYNLIQCQNWINLFFFQYSPDGTGGWDFECQHGEEECIGNLYQVCLVDKVTDKSVQMDAINCIMADRQQSSATEKVRIIGKH